MSPAKPSNAKVSGGGAQRKGLTAMNDQTNTNDTEGMGAAFELSAGLCMLVGKRYIVTKASDDGTFEIGDHVSMNAEGSINCREAQGWIDACNVAEASAGMAVVIDQEWIAQRKEKLREELAALDA